jgi:hypothetical protein
MMHAVHSDDEYEIHILSMCGEAKDDV